MHARDFCVGIQECRHLHGGGALRLIAEKIGLHAALDQPRGIEIEHAAQQHEVRAQAADQFGRTDHHATHYVTVTRCVLGQAVQEQVDISVAMLVKAGQRVVQQGERTGGARQRRDLARYPRCA